MARWWRPPPAGSCTSASSCPMSVQPGSPTGSTLWPDAERQLGRGPSRPLMPWRHCQRLTRTPLRGASKSKLGASLCACAMPWAIRSAKGGRGRVRSLPEFPIPGTPATGPRSWQDDRVTTGDVRYAQVGEASIAYRVSAGEGPYFLDITSPAPGLLLAEHPLTRRHWYQRISRFARPVIFDVQGSGRSDPLPSGIAASVERQAEQAVAVLTSAGIEPAYVCGWDSGGAAAVTVAAQRPDLVSGLILVNAYARVLLDDDYSWGVERSALDWYLQARRDRHGSGFLLKLFAPSVSHDPEVREF